MVLTLLGVNVNRMATGVIAGADTGLPASAMMQGDGAAALMPVMAAPVAPRANTDGTAATACETRAMERASFEVAR
jgi:hypothetical protein